MENKGFKYGLILDVTPEEFFDFLCTALLEDLNAYGKKELELSDLKSGLSYEKPFGKNGKLRVTVEKFVRPTEYRVKMVASGDTYFSTYELENVEGDCGVIYTESRMKESKEASALQRWLKERKIRSMLKGIERRITDQRKADAKK